MPDRATRREFTRLIGLGTSAPLILLGRKAPILGSGAHCYEFEKDFFQVPADWKWGFTHGVAVDEHGRILVHHTGPKPMAVFDSKGKLMKHWGAEFEGGAHGLTLYKDGNDQRAILCDTKRRVVEIFTPDGEKVMTLPYPQLEGAYNDAEKRRYVPTNAAVTKDGTIFVADGYGQSYVHIYSKNGEYRKSFGGGKSKEVGKLHEPHGIWIDARSGKELVLVADRTNERLQYFTTEGKHVSFVYDELRQPCHFDIRKGELLIPDLNGRLTLFDRNNKLITHLGDNPEIWKDRRWPNLPPTELVDGKFNSPHSACFDKRGNIFVVEWIRYGRVSKLRKV
jgi:hypothetical protein